MCVEVESVRQLLVFWLMGTTKIADSIGSILLRSKVPRHALHDVVTQGVQSAISTASCMFTQYSNYVMGALFESTMQLYNFALSEANLLHALMQSGFVCHRSAS